MSTFPAKRGESVKAGACIFIKHEISRINAATQVKIEKDLLGFIAHVTLTTASSHLKSHILGVYMPSDDIATRQRIYDYIKELVEKCRERKAPLIILGDMNAASSPTDRSSRSLTPLDKAHIEWLDELGLAPIGLDRDDPTRPHTFYRDGQSSRIDDIIYLSQSPPDKLQSEQTFEPEGSMDHQGIHCTCPPKILPLHRADLSHLNQAFEPRLVCPIKKTQGEAARQKAIERPEVAAFTDSVVTLGNELLDDMFKDRKKPPSKDPSFKYSEVTTDKIIMRQDDLGASQADEASVIKLTELLETALDATKETFFLCCDTTNPGHQGTNRTAKRHFNHLRKEQTLLKVLDQNLGHTLPLSDKATRLLIESSNAVPENDQDLTKLRDAIKAKKADTDEALKEKRRERLNDDRDRARKTFQTGFTKDMKRYHRKIYSKIEGDNLPPLRLLKGKDGKISSDVKDIANQFFQSLHNPTHILRTGQYRPESRASPYPFTSQDSPDPFTISKDPRASDSTKATLINTMADSSVFHDRVKWLSHHKQPGPDGIQNEMIQWLPEPLLEAIHRLFIIFYITGITPRGLTDSTTVLLFKKGNKLELKNYRPIALARTIYKLWTSMLTYVNLDYALTNNIIHKGQEGAIRGRNTHRQITTLVNAFEDAHHSKKDIFALYIDFSSAFSLIDQDKLLGIMWDIGVPEDSIRVIRNIYSSGRTTVKLPAGSIDPIPITRGTIQGDPLSPLLFIFYIEPLLRWLSKGQRGYTFGCLKGQQTEIDTGSGQPTLYPSEIVNRLSALGFLDDTAALTNTREDMEVQAKKIDLFSSWAGMPVNNLKCAFTGILHGSSPKDPKHSCLFKATRFFGTPLMIGGAVVPVLSPDEAYKYLGVHITASLSWEEQMRERIKHIRELGNMLLRSLASPRQKIMSLMIKIKQSAVYDLNATCYSAPQIRFLDREIAKIARKCRGLNQSFPTSAILRTKKSAGLGVGSLMIEYARICSMGLKRHLDDPGLLGAVTRALLEIQMQDAAGLPVDELDTPDARYHSLLRRKAIIERHQLRAVRDGEVLKPHQYDKDDIFSLLATLNESGIKASHLQPLFSIGIRRISPLIEPSGTRLIDAQALKRLYPSATTAHCIAFNRLSLAMSETPQPKLHSPWAYNSSQALTQQQRSLPAHLRPDLATRSFPWKAIGTRNIADIIGEAHALDDEPLFVTVGGKRTKLSNAILGRKKSKAYFDEHALHEVTMPDLPDPCGSANGPTSFWNSLLNMCRRPREYQEQLSNMWDNLGVSPAGLQNLTAPQFRQKVLESPCIPRVLLDALYDNQMHLFDVTEAVLKFTNGEKSTSNKRRHQTQYLAQTQPMLIARDHLQAFNTCPKSHSYTSKVRYDSDFNLLSPTGPTCFPHLPIPDIRFLSSHPQPPQFIWVTWEFAYEPLETLQKDPAFHELLEAAKTRGRERALPPSLPSAPTYPHDGLPDFIQQGLSPLPPRMGPFPPGDLRRFIYIDNQPCHPNRDCEPSGSYNVQQSPSDEVSILDKDGKWIRDLPLKTTRALHAQYSTTHQTTHPDLHPFARAVADIITAYHKSPKEPSWDSIKRLWQTPHPLMQAIKTHCSSQSYPLKELFASPLDRSIASDLIFSSRPEDSVFGANHDAFAQPWTGLCQAYPGPDPGLNQKALQWALKSIETPIPTCIFYLVNNNPRTSFGYLNLLSHSTIVHIADGVKLEPGYRVPTNHPAETVSLIAIANEEGKTRFLQDSTRQLLARSVGLETIPPRTSGPTPTLHPPVKLLKLLEPSTPKLPPPTLCQIEIDSSLTFPVSKPLATPIGYEIIFTDGSSSSHEDGSPSVGAAAVIVRPDHDKDLIIYINPNGQGITNTNNRAELSAINIPLLKSLECNHYLYHKHLIIYTDSKGSIDLIRKIMDRPWEASENKHLPLLLSIANTLRERAELGLYTSIRKVISHSGIYGNDQADAAAKKAARWLKDPSSKPEVVDIITDEANNQPYEGKTWILKVDTGDRNCRPVANLASGISRTIEPSYSGGSFQTQGAYAQSWDAVLKNNNLDLDSSFHYWDSSLISSAEATAVFKGSWGGLINRKLLHRWGLVADDACPLCGKPDSFGHMIGECEHASAKPYIIARHNDAVRLIQKCIHKHSTTVGDALTTMDVGKDKRPAGIIDRVLPSFFIGANPQLPNNILETRETILKGRPDILIAPGLPAREAPASDCNYLSEEARLARERLHSKPVHMIEVGYCRDTKHEEKYAEKSNQHEHCRTGLKQHGYDLKYHIITLGHCGTIPKALRDILKTELGVPSEMIAQCAKSLHISAVKHLFVIYQNRMEFERVHGVFSNGSSPKGNMRWRHLPRAPDLQPPTPTESHEDDADELPEMNPGARDKEMSPPSPTPAMQPSPNAPRNHNDEHSDHNQREGPCPEEMRLSPARNEGQARTFREHFRPRLSPDPPSNERARRKPRSKNNDTQNINSKRPRNDGTGCRGKRKSTSNQTANQRRHHQTTQSETISPILTDQRPQGTRRTWRQPTAAAMLDPAPPAPAVQQSSDDIVRMLMQAGKQPAKRSRKNQLQQPRKKQKACTQTSIRPWLKRPGDNIETLRQAKKGRGGALDGGSSLATAADVYPQAPPEQPKEHHLEPRQGTPPQPLVTEDWDHG